MATYLVLNLVFMVAIIAALKLLGILQWNKTMTYLLILLTMLTIIFDSLIIAASIVDYDTAKILGVRIGLAPVEDFMYAALAVIVIPALWRGMEDRRAR